MSLGQGLLDKGRAGLRFRAVVAGGKKKYLVRIYSPEVKGQLELEPEVKSPAPALAENPRLQRLWLQYPGKK